MGILFYIYRQRINLLPRPIIFEKNFYNIKAPLTAFDIRGASSLFNICVKESIVYEKISHSLRHIEHRFYIKLSKVSLIA